MVAITTDNGTFEADDIKTAIRKERKAARENAKLNGIRSKRKETARVFAQAQAWRFACRKQEETGIPRGWRFMPAGSPHMACKVLPSESANELTLEIETETGKGVLSWWRASFVGVIENGAGWIMAVIIHLQNESEPMFLAVGTHEGEASFELMDGWTKEMFRHTNDN